MKRHNPTAADIDVTENCFCSVFFAGLYLSSSKTALIFHGNKDVFVNREIRCNSTCSTISLFLLAPQWRIQRILLLIGQIVNELKPRVLALASKLRLFFLD